MATYAIIQAGHLIDSFVSNRPTGVKLTDGQAISIMETIYHSNYAGSEIHLPGNNHVLLAELTRTSNFCTVNIHVIATSLEEAEKVLFQLREIAGCQIGIPRRIQLPKLSSAWHRFKYLWNYIFHGTV